MKKIKMNYLLFCLLISSTSNLVLAQDNVDTSKLTEGPQALDNRDVTEDLIKDSQNATPQTEVVKTPSDSDALAPDLDLTEKEKAPETKPKSPVKNQVLSEEELLTPKSKKDNSKVVSQKINESEIYIQDSEKYKIIDNFKSIKLNDVIEQGLRKNYDQGLRDQNDSLADLTFEGTKRAFWYPSIKLTMSTNSQLISLINKSYRANGSVNPVTPTGTVGLSLGDYTVFNWGKDYAVYLNSKSSYQRQKEIYNESKRELKLDLIYNYFNLVSTKNVEKIRQDQLRQASFVYRLNKEKITIGKTSQQDYYQSRSEYLKAQNDFHDAKMQSDIYDENMSFSIADEVGTKYVLTEGLDYKRIKVSLSESINSAETNNPTILTKKVTLENAERSYDVAQKENMPLPKFSMNLGAYNKKFGPTTNQTLYETYTGNGNVELVASVNATWDITGENGFLNGNKLAKSRIAKEIANYDLNKNKHYTDSILRETYKNVLSYQNQMLIIEARLPSVQKTFDAVLENYLNGKARYNDFHIALNDLADTKIIMEKIKLNHLKEKLNLAKYMGVEDFPGENFERLAVKVKGK